MIRIDLDDLTFSGMEISGEIEDNGFICVRCNGYLDWRDHRLPEKLAELVVEGFEDMGEEMSEDERAELPVWNEVEKRVAEAYRAYEAASAAA